MDPGAGVARRILRILGSLGLTQLRCSVCRRPFEPADSAARHLALCPDCAAQASRHSGARCRACGLPLPGAGLCGQCLTRLPPWRALAYYGLYQGLLRDMLLDFKFAGALHLRRQLGLFLLEAACALPRPQALLAVPQHPDHMRARGFNQAQELARELSRLSGIALLTGLLERPGWSRTQSGLSARDRPANVRGIFRAGASKVAGLRLWLVDDIVTTGSTAAEACSALKRAGALETSVICVARTPRQRPQGT